MDGERRWFRLLGAACLGLALGGARSSAQTVESNTTITGPRGRSIERQVEIERTPGGVERQIKITRPGGTFQRDVQIQRVPGGVGLGPRPFPRGGWFPRPVFVQPAPAFGFGLMAAPLLNFSFGGGGVGVGGPMMGPGMGVGGGPMGGPVQAPPDKVAIETQRMQSMLPNTRKEAAYALGKLGDPRAVPSLVNALKHDYFKDVRVASAIALGEIGGSEAAVALERSAIYDHKDEVKKASSTALTRLNAKAKANAAWLARARMSAPAPAPLPPPVSASPFGPSTSGYPSQGSAPTAVDPAADPPQSGELVPPPPPTPVGPTPG